jgi:hypothetical protein
MHNVGPQIMAGVQFVADTALANSPGVRVLDLLYMYLHDKGDACAENHQTVDGTWHGSRSDINYLDSLLRQVQGPQVYFLNARCDYPYGFGPQPLGFLQLTRDFGYPHPNDLGQTTLGHTAANNMTAFSAPK